MRFFMSLALTALLVLPAAAEEAIALKVTNGSSLTVVALNTFPLDDDGEPVEDNLGALMEDLPPGGKVELELSMTKCGSILAVVGLSNQTEARLDLDLCKDQTLTLHD